MTKPTNVWREAHGTPNRNEAAEEVARLQCMENKLFELTSTNLPDYDKCVKALAPCTEELKPKLLYKYKGSEDYSWNWSSNDVAAIFPKCIDSYKKSIGR